MTSSGPNTNPSSGGPGGIITSGLEHPLTINKKEHSNKTGVIDE
jgi:hypothetical protein